MEGKSPTFNNDWAYLKIDAWKKYSSSHFVVYLTSHLFRKSFSDETKKYIEFSDDVIVIKNRLLIDVKGRAAKPQQTVIIRLGKIDWVGDDSKANIPKGAAILDLKGKAIMPSLVMLHEQHVHICKL